MSVFNHNFTARNIPTLIDVAAGGISGASVSMKGFNRFQAIIQVDKGALPETITATATQYQEGGANGKALNLELAYHRNGNDAKFTRLDQVGDSNTIDVDALAGENAVLIIEIMVSDLDINASFEEVGIALSGSTTRVHSLMYNQTAAINRPVGN